MPSRRFDDPQLEISWRTEELGPEVRRALFKKANPWIKLASSNDGPAARLESTRDNGPQDPAKKPSQSRNRQRITPPE